MRHCLASYQITMIFGVYNLGFSTQLDQATALIYANFSKAFAAIRETKILPGNGKKGDSKQDRMFGRVSKIPIADAFIELDEVDFLIMRITPPSYISEIPFLVSRYRVPQGKEACGTYSGNGLRIGDFKLVSSA